MQVTDLAGKTIMFYSNIGMKYQEAKNIAKGFGAHVTTNMAEADIMVTGAGEGGVWAAKQHGVEIMPADQWHVLINPNLSPEDKAAKMADLAEKERQQAAEFAAKMKEREEAAIREEEERHAELSALVSKSAEVETIDMLYSMSDQSGIPFQGDFQDDYLAGITTVEEAKTFVADIEAAIEETDYNGSMPFSASPTALKLAKTRDDYIEIGLDLIGTVTSIEKQGRYDRDFRFGVTEDGDFILVDIHHNNGGHLGEQSALKAPDGDSCILDEEDIDYLRETHPEWVAGQKALKESAEV